ncbi:hypothetical protein AVEN_268297-1 [Araneus ventricosus]|uniref:Uncharacterized protein n=1 Tax=Araneus ventricosus TaxID=182803 RepID=A0A4Y2C4G4_ARAVE|nr:hypothetical protein AVEN_268297-1 [Araneus ventricosus]
MIPNTPPRFVNNGASIILNCSFIAYPSLPIIPIEHLCKEIGRELKKCDITNQDWLNSAIQDIWNNISPETTKNTHGSHATTFERGNKGQRMASYH